MLALSGKHALVTGGSRGIGAAVAAELLDQGAKVTLLARHAAELQLTASRLSESGDVAFVVADVRMASQVKEALEQANKYFGSVAILINNAGQAESMPFMQTDAASWQRMLEVNLSGTFFCTQATLPFMQSSGWGRIVNVASSAGIQGYPYVAAYCAAKHGVVGLTRALALELEAAAKSSGKDVTVNAVCPGYTDTPMLRDAIAALAARTGRSSENLCADIAAQNADGRLLCPREVAQKVVEFCLPQAARFNGEIASL